jgi:hypothetical protein
MKTQRLRLVACALLTAALGAPMLAEGQQPRRPAPVDLSGMWLVQDPGSGSWTNWFMYAVTVGKPALRPEVIAENDRLNALEAKGAVTNTMRRRLDCPTGSIAMMMASSSPLNIVQGSIELLMGAEAGRGRVIALDGRPLPDVKSPTFVPTGAGYSVGRWDGNELVVETVGFATDVCDSRRPSGGLTPGQGRVRSTTRLRERYRLDGDTLNVTFTWEDPTVFVKPYTYTYSYQRLPDAEAFENEGQG